MKVARSWYACPAAAAMTFGSCTKGVPARTASKEPFQIDGQVHRLSSHLRHMCCCHDRVNIRSSHHWCSFIIGRVCCVRFNSFSCTFRVLFRGYLLSCFTLLFTSTYFQPASIRSITSGRRGIFVVPLRRVREPGEPGDGGTGCVDAVGGLGGSGVGSAPITELVAWSALP